MSENLHETLTREHAAWLDVGQEFVKRGIDINESDWDRLIHAIRKWGEELVQLRLHAPEHTQTALREARQAYEGQFERGTYPEEIEQP